MFSAFLASCWMRWLHFLALLCGIGKCTIFQHPMGCQMLFRSLHPHSTLIVKSAWDFFLFVQLLVGKNGFGMAAA